jgi:hypothetical protein
MLSRFIRSSLLSIVLFLPALVPLNGCTECGDGWIDATYDATFTSSCPADVGPPSGEVHITTPKGEHADPMEAIGNALRSAGFRTQTPAVHKDGVAGDTDVCVAIGFDMYGSGDTMEWFCSETLFGVKEQVVTCEGRTRFGKAPEVDDAGVPRDRFTCKITFARARSE